MNRSALPTLRTTPLRDEPLYRQAAFILRVIWRHPSNRGRRVRRILFATGFQLWARLFRRPMTVRVGERSRIRAYRHMSGTTEVVYANPPACELLVWGKHLVKGSLFIDVGANAGVYSVWALEKGARVIAIEPNALACRRFRENLELNSYDAELIEAAIADEEGDALMTTDLDVANHLVIAEPGGDNTTTLVRVTTLDAVLGDRVADGVKIDVEGAELLALKGARRALSEHRIRLLQLEWNSCSLTVTGQDRKSTAEFLAGYGYELLRADDRGDLHPVEDLSFGADTFARPATN